MRPSVRLHRWMLVAATLLLLIAATVAQATTITYGTYNRPVSFIGVELYGGTFDVEVIWNSTYNAIFSSELPMFLNDEPGAQDALAALLQALADDGYTTASLQSFLDVPYSNSGTLVNAWGADLNYSPPVPQMVNSYPFNGYSTIGYTVWTVVIPVKTETSTWGQIKALYER